MTQTLDVSTLSVAQTGSATTLILLAVTAIAIAVCLFAAARALSRPSVPTPPSSRARGTHSRSPHQNAWRSRVEDVVRKNHSGTMDDDEAYAALARIAREFAEESTGTPMGSRTLSDISELRSTTSHTDGIDMLRHTIAAIYPAEFSARRRNPLVADTTVDDAAEWVLNLVDRWRR